MAHDKASNERFKIMEKKLYYAITTPGAIITIVLGMWLIHNMGWEVFKLSYWLHAKLGLVLLLLGFHGYCGILMKALAEDKSQKSEKFFRLINEIPVLPLIGIIVLAVVRPF